MSVKNLIEHLGVHDRKHLGFLSIFSFIYSFSKRALLQLQSPKHSIPNGLQTMPPAETLISPPNNS